MKALTLMNNLRNKFQKGQNDSHVALDNDEVIEILNDESVAVKDVMGQETWVMDDGSYITRNNDEYWLGTDIDDFETV